MLNEEFLKGVLENTEMESVDKIKQILSEHEASTRGLLSKRDELLGSEKKLKEQISTFETQKAEYESKINSLNDALSKASSNDNKEYYEAQLKELANKHSSELDKLTSERDFYKQSHFSALRDKAIQEGIKDLKFIDGLKDGFIARVLSINNFEPKEIDGQWKFLNKEHHSIEEAISSFALSQEGKAYIQNSSGGGGASNITSTKIGNGQVSSQQVENMSDAELMEFALKGGQVI